MNNEISSAQKYIRANLRDRNLWSKPGEYDLSQNLNHQILFSNFSGLYLCRNKGRYYDL